MPDPSSHEPRDSLRRSGAAESRIACVELPAFPLQLLLREHPRWRELPVAVVEADRPQAKLLWVNEHARRLRVLPGMRFAAARSLAGDLRASVVNEAMIEAGIAELFALLIGFSPRVEPLAEHPSTFFVDPSGMTLLWGQLESWALAIHERLDELGFSNSVIVGFHRFRTHAIARTHAGAWVIADPQREARLAASVPLERLDVAPRLRDELAKLGVSTLGQFLALPGSEMRLRFGVEAERLHQRACEGRWEPLQPRELIEPIGERLQLEPAEADLARLLFRVKPLLERLLARLVERSQAMSALRLRLTFERIAWPADRPPVHEERLEPAAPTLDARQILELLRLRLDALQLPSPIEELELELEGQRTDPGQLALFRVQARRDLDAANRALARLRASFGPESITRAALKPAHLPEARYAWTPIKKIGFPSPERMQGEGELPPLNRRLLHRPEPLPPRPKRESDGWIIDPSLGPVTQMYGPYRASGGWWVREVERDYYYAQTRSGVVLWVFYDRPRGRWYLHGRVD